jgi:hypothetical protein
LLNPKVNALSKSKLTLSLFEVFHAKTLIFCGKDIALKVWGKAPLLDLAENWHGDRSLCPEQCLNDPQAASSTP